MTIPPTVVRAPRPLLFQKQKVQGDRQGDLLDSSNFAGVTPHRGVNVAAVVWVIGVSREVGDSVGVAEVYPPPPVALRLIPFLSPPAPRNSRQVLSPPFYISMLQTYG